VKCSYCGKEYIHGSKVCPFCYAKIGTNTLEDADIIEEKKDDNYLFEVNVPAKEEFTSTSINLVMASDTTMLPKVYNKKKIERENTKGIWKSIVAIILLLACLTGLTMLLINNRHDRGTDDDEVVIAAPVIKTETEFLGYKINAPKGFEFITQEGVEYAQGEECIIVYKENDLNYDLIAENKESIIASLNEQGIYIISFVVKESSGHNYILIVGEKEGLTYGYVLGKIEDKSVLATIRSRDNSLFKQAWFTPVIKMFASAK
jgi:hypothetical protein